MFFLLFGIFFYCCLCWVALSGTFVLDDFVNLEYLSNVKDPDSFWAFTLNGVASRLGRPLSLFSFALQASSWPENPYNFKLVNLFIHALNAALLFILLRLLCSVIKTSFNLVVWLPLLVSLFWLFAPVHTSTVFYVIQRMTLLSASFTLIGLISFVYGWKLINEGRLVFGYSVELVGVGLGFLLGVLAKENGILISCYTLLLHFLLGNPQVKIRYWKIWIFLIGILPICLFLTYLVFYRGIANTYSNREFTLIERLLTESIILWEYIRIIFVPTPEALNIYNDGYPISRSLFRPPITILSQIAWVLLIAVVTKYRRVYPIAFFGLLWFLLGHSLESTVIGLELYFEHRNYLPSIGPILAVVFIVLERLDFWQKKKPSHIVAQKGVTLVGIAILVLFAFTLRIEAKTWSNPEQFSMTAIRERPNSMRAWFDAANYFANKRDYETSAGLVYLIDQRWPKQSGVIANKVLLNCVDPAVVAPEGEELVELFANSEFDSGFESAMREILNVKKIGGCNKYSWDDYRQWILIQLQRPVLSKTNERNFVVLISYSYNAEEKYEEAAESLNMLDENRADIEFYILKAQFNAMAGNYDFALSVLERSEARFSSNKLLWLPAQDRISNLKKMIINQM